MRLMTISLLLIFMSAPIASGLPTRFYIWNVGQGQWLTLALETECVHFDMGGEQAPKKIIRELCKNKNNSLYLSHADTDHISFIFWAQKNLNSLCLQSLPRETLNRKKKWLLNSIPKCNSLSKYVTELSVPEWFTKPNDMSRVFVLKRARGDLLIPGDSSIAAEKYWTQQLNSQNIKILILGHHGSQTSTGDALLDSLRNLNLAFCSARKRRYGHPHPNVLSRLEKAKLPLVITETWGNLSIEF